MPTVRNYRQVFKYVDGPHIENSTGIVGVTTAPDTTKLATIEVTVPDGVSDYDVANIDQYMLDKGFELLT